MRYLTVVFVVIFGFQMSPLLAVESPAVPPSEVCKLSLFPGETGMTHIDFPDRDPAPLEFQSSCSCVFEVVKTARSITVGFAAPKSAGPYEVRARWIDGTKSVARAVIFHADVRDVWHRADSETWAPLQLRNESDRLFTQTVRFERRHGDPAWDTVTCKVASDDGVSTWNSAIRQEGDGYILTVSKNAGDSYGLADAVLQFSFAQNGVELPYHPSLRCTAAINDPTWQTTPVRIIAMRVGALQVRKSILIESSTGSIGTVSAQVDDPFVTVEIEPLDEHTARVHLGFGPEAKSGVAIIQSSEKKGRAWRVPFTIAP